MKQSREDTNYLLSADPNDFDLEDAWVALIKLEDDLDDISFQLNDVPEEEFRGPNYTKWRMSASFKRNRIASARRRFKKRVNMLILGALSITKPCG
jgi:hypothetical protein